MNKFRFLFVFVIFLLSTGSLCAYSQNNDEELVKTLEFVDVTKPETNLKYNYSSVESVPIALRITEKISTKNSGVYEGQVLNFKVQKDVFVDNELLLKKGLIVKAKVQTVMSKGMNGIPAEIVLGDFSVPGIDNTKLYSYYSKYGADRSLYVLPLKWALTVLPPSGSLTNFIPGGEAKIDLKDDIILYYYPEWGEVDENVLIDENKEKE